MGLSLFGLLLGLSLFGLSFFGLFLFLRSRRMPVRGGGRTAGRRWGPR